MVLDLQSLFGLHVHCTAVLIGRDPSTPPPQIHILAHIRGRYWSAKIGDPLFVTPCPVAISKMVLFCGFF
jgi:hypothetical protein